MARVFLSYARDDTELAKRLAGLIGQAGHEVWWDREIQGGSHFSSEIDKALQEAEAVLVLWSESSVKSAWVQDEAAEGRDSGRLVPAVVNGVRPPLGFRQYQSVELGQWRGDGEPNQFDALLRAIDKTGDGKTVLAKPVEQAPKASGPSVCVLPFVNMSGDPEQEYFSDGISEDIITDLSNVSALSVVARNTSFTFKGQSLDLKDVAHKLGITHVLEGSVRKAGNRVRITAQLIDGAKGDHVWAARYDRDLTDIFAIQDEISKAIVGALKVRLLPEEKEAIEDRGTANVEAYSLYLMAREQWVSGGFAYPDRHRMIVRLCREATTLDPEYAQAWALMALSQALLRFWHGSEEDALPAAERALALNPRLPEAQCVKARYLDDEGQSAEAESLIRTALELAPDSWEANRELAAFLYRHARTAEAIPYFEKAASLMDSDTSSSAMLMSCYQAAGNDEKLREAAQLCVTRAERAIARDPSHANELAWGSSALACLGENDRARDWARRALLIDPDNQGMRYNIACCFSVALLDHQAALEVLGPYFERLDSRMQLKHLEADPDFEPIRDNPKFREMLGAAKRRLGMAESVTPVQATSAVPQA
jgi:adenylate cyclase